jgi:hypothetical protein
VAVPQPAVAAAASVLRCLRLQHGAPGVLSARECDSGPALCDLITLLFGTAANSPQAPQAHSRDQQSQRRTSGSHWVAPGSHHWVAPLGRTTGSSSPAALDVVSPGALNPAHPSP